MRLGGPVFLEQPDPDRWAAAVLASGYRAAYCPVSSGSDTSLIQAYARAAHNANIVIAEVGAWSNPLSPDAVESASALAFCQSQLSLAEEIGAVCCVNIAGSCGSVWDGPHPDNLTSSTFDRVVETVRKIIDAVHPVRTYFTLEPMPWMFPDSPDHYLDLIHAIHRERFAVHLDPVNMICSPQRYFDNAGFIRECFKKLGPYIKSCHAKDIRLANQLTTHLDEAIPGTGYLDYRTFLFEVNRLQVDTPLMLEHLQSEVEYQQAAQHVRSVAQELGISL
jgi:sugar phosphate isomerase/epimerase